MFPWFGLLGQKSTVVWCNLRAGAAVLGTPDSRGRPGVLSGRLGLQTGGAGVKWEICFFWFKNCRLRA